MTTMNLMLSEMRFRWLNSVLTLGAIVAAATLLVGGPTLIAGYNARTNQLLADKEAELTGQLDQQKRQQADELEAERLRLQEKLETLQDERDAVLAEMDKKTKRLMRDIGFNVKIYHEDTDMVQFHSELQAVDMPEDYVHKLGSSEEITKVRHIVATLQEKYKWNDRTVIVMGILPSVVQAHLEKKPPMGYRIEPGTVYMGHEIAGDRKEGDRIVLGEQSFRIAKILPEQGTKEDIMIAMELHDAQKVLGKEEKINQILALGCQCEFERLPEIRAQLQKVLPDTQVTEFRSIAIARAEQRKLVAEKRAALIARTKADHERILEEQRQHNAQMIAQKEKDNQQTLAGIAAQRREIESTLITMFNVLAPLVVLICTMWIGLLAWNNVRERQPEIGILRALGKGSGSIAALLLGKAALLGLLGGLIGCGLGYLIAAGFGSQAMQTALLWLVVTVVGAPLVALLATYLPAVFAMRQDPAIVLRDQ